MRLAASTEATPGQPIGKNGFLPEVPLFIWTHVEQQMPQVEAKSSNFAFKSIAIASLGLSDSHETATALSEQYHSSLLIIGQSNTKPPDSLRSMALRGLGNLDFCTLDFVLGGGAEAS